MGGCFPDVWQDTVGGNSLACRSAITRPAVADFLSGLLQAFRSCTSF